MGKGDSTTGQNKPPGELVNFPLPYRSYEAHVTLIRPGSLDTHAWARLVFIGAASEAEAGIADFGKITLLFFDRESRKRGGGR
jgi:hypothetical protein